MESIGQRLQRVREASGLGRKVFSELCGLGASHVRMIETGDVKEPDLKTLRKIAETAGAEVGWLALGIGDAPDTDAVRTRCAALRAELGASDEDDAETDDAAEAP